LVKESLYMPVGFTIELSSQGLVNINDFLNGVVG